MMAGLFTSSTPDELDEEKNSLLSFKAQLETDLADCKEHIESLHGEQERLKRDVASLHRYKDTVLGADSDAAILRDAAEDHGDTLPETFTVLTETVHTHLEQIQRIVEAYQSYSERVETITEDIHDAVDHLTEYTDQDDDLITDAIKRQDEYHVPDSLKPLFRVYQDNEEAVTDAVANAERDLRVDHAHDFIDDLKHHKQKLRDHLVGVQEADGENPEKLSHDVSKIIEHLDQARTSITNHIGTILTVKPRAEDLNAYQARVKAAYSKADDLRVTRTKIIQEFQVQRSTLRQQGERLRGVKNDLDQQRAKFVNATRRIKDLLATAMQTEDHADDNGFVPQHSVPNDLHDDLDSLQTQQRNAITSYLKHLSRVQAVVNDDLLSLFAFDDAQDHLDQAHQDVFLHDETEQSIRDQFHDAYYLALPDEDDDHRDNASFLIAQRMDDTSSHVKAVINTLQ